MFFPFIFSVHYYQYNDGLFFCMWKLQIFFLFYMYIDKCKEPRLISHLKMCFIVLVYHNKMCRKLNLVFILRIFIHLKQLLYLLPAIVSLFVYKLFFFSINYVDMQDVLMICLYTEFFLLIFLFFTNEVFYVVRIG